MPELGIITDPGEGPIPEYRNPVFPESFPDPFVLKFGRYYYGYCTGFSASGLVFDVVRSVDLINWQRLGGAMEPLASAPPYYWAPETIYRNGNFYLYYSCGNETLMEIRVAVSDRPDGGFVDSGHRLTKEEFAIDAHVFTDEDGQKYLFYATDFLGHTHIGTGTVVDRMRDWFELEGNPTPVTRAAFDWQVYDPNRIEKGGVRWHTVEGPTVFKYKKRYFQMFSGGNWKNSTYGVGFATSDAVLDSREWRQSIDGETIFPILRTIPDKVIGPGHNSAIVGPNGRELFCVYHSWVGDARVMAIDRMDFVSDRLFVNGPTFDPQPVPFRPTVDLESLVDEFAAQRWQRLDESIVSPNEGETAVPIGRFGSGLLLRFTARIGTVSGSNGSLSITFDNDAMATLIRVDAGSNKVWLTRGSVRKGADIPEQINLGEYQTFTAEINASRFSFSVNGRPLVTADKSESEIYNISLQTADASCEINDLLLTEGFVDMFDEDASAAEWNILGENGIVEIAGGELHFFNPGQEAAIITKGVAYPFFEFAANIRRVNSEGADNSFGFVLLNEAGEIVNRFEIVESPAGSYHLETGVGAGSPLPPNYSPDIHRQFRFVRTGSSLRLETEDQFLGEVNVGTFPATVGILCKGAVVGLDMVRMIRLM